MPISGYNRTFLPVDLPLPYPVDGRVVIDLPNVHFSVLLDPVRRLAAATGVNIDGAALLDLDWSDDWHLDPRVLTSKQAGADVYARNDLDRGHLVRRRDPVWGNHPLQPRRMKRRSFSPMPPHKPRSSTRGPTSGSVWRITC
jgi:endonuclease G